MLPTPTFGVAMAAVASVEAVRRRLICPREVIERTVEAEPAPSPYLNSPSASGGKLAAVGRRRGAHRHGATGARPDAAVLLVLAADARSTRMSWLPRRFVAEVARLLPD